VWTGYLAGDLEIANAPEASLAPPSIPEPTWPTPGRTPARFRAQDDLSHALAVEALARSDEACLVLDRTGTIRFANAAAARIAGVELVAHIGRSAPQVLPQFLQSRFAQICRRAIITGRTMHGEAADWPDGRAFDLRCVPLQDGIALFARDVTQRRRAERAAALVAEAGAVLNSSLDLPGTLEAVARLIIPEFADTCFIDLVEPHGGTRRVVAVHRDPAISSTLRRLYERLPVDERHNHPVHGVLASGRTLFVRNASPEVLTGMATYDEERKLALSLRLTSILIVPLHAGHDVIGAASFGTIGGRPCFDDLDRTLAEDLAVRIGQAVHNARLHEAQSEAKREVERALARLSQMQEASAALTLALPKQQVVRVIVEQAVRAVGAVAGAIVERSGDGREFVLLHSTGYDDKTIGAFTRYNVDVPVPTRDVARTFEPVYLRSFDEWQARYPVAPPRVHGAWAIVPLCFEDRLLAVLVLSFPRARGFSAEDREFIAALARQCAQAMERARLYESAQEARAAAESASQAKSQFLAVMSHELRTPLTGVLGYTELLEGGLAGELSEKQHLYLTRIRTGARHLRDLISEVLSLARIEAGRETLHRASVDLAMVARDAVGVLQPLAAQKGIGIRLELPNAPAVAITDAGKLRQILINLLSNAVKFTDEGGAALRLSINGGDTFSFIVSDTGPGIALCDQQRIFEPFMQADGSNTREKGGSGLGLTVSRRLARLLGGDLHVHSVPGEGSTFALQLPLRMPDAL
jgi:PAS domain S-box-containing protein